MRRTLMVAALAGLALLGGCRKPGRAGYASNDRTAIRVVGAPALFERNVAVASAFSAAHPSLPAVVVEIMPDPQALALLCRASALTAPDVAILTRQPAPESLASCRAHGVATEIMSLAPDGAALQSVLVVNRAHLARLRGLRDLLALYSADAGPAKAAPDRH